MEKLELDIAVGLRSYELGLSLAVGAETVALVGPSGAGKSTVLRAVAGLQRPDRGRIALGETVWLDRAAKVNLPPEGRSVGLVFQDYALFPHMTVRGNVEFGGDDRADELLERFGIAHLAAQRPGMISGGERQRVALARALARAPQTLLLDEPLAALDAHTRAVVRAELQDLLAGLALPTLLVTHDFRDASALSDRIGVLVDGRIRQLGTHAELLAKPADASVVRLTGGNLLPGVAREGGVALEAGPVVPVRTELRGEVWVAVQPWQMGLARRQPDDNATIHGRVHGLAPDGGRVRLRIGPVELELSRPEAAGLTDGDEAWAVIDPATVHVLRRG